MIYETVPETYDGNEIDYVWAICQCPIPTTKGIKIPKHLFKNGKCKFRCKNCGLVGTLVSNENRTKEMLI